MTACLAARQNDVAGLIACHGRGSLHNRSRAGRHRGDSGIAALDNELLWSTGLVRGNHAIGNSWVTSSAIVKIVFLIGHIGCDCCRVWHGPGFHVADECREVDLGEIDLLDLGWRESRAIRRLGGAPPLADLRPALLVDDLGKLGVVAAISIGVLQAADQRDVYRAERTNLVTDVGSKLELSLHFLLVAGEHGFDHDDGCGDGNATDADRGYFIASHVGQRPNHIHGAAIHQHSGPSLQGFKFPIGPSSGHSPGSVPECPGDALHGRAAVAAK